MIHIFDGMLSPRRSTPMFKSQEDQALFRARLAEVAEWCNLEGKLGDPAKSLRTMKLRPDTFSGEGLNKFWMHDRDVKSVVDQLCTTRATLLKGHPGTRPDRGGLLLFWPEETLDCGAAEVTSKGYFDVGNAPPWDTWFWYGPLKNEQPALVSYVPEEFLNLVVTGTDNNPEQCIRLIGIS